MVPQGREGTNHGSQEEQNNADQPHEQRSHDQRPTTAGTPPGKLADVELHFSGNSPLAGLKLIGFSVWERRGGTGRT
jgi:hypothetical protein